MSSKKLPEGQGPSKREVRVSIGPADHGERSQQYSALAESIDEILEAQRTVLRLIDFIGVRSDEIDDVRSRVLARVRVEYPDVDEDVVTTFLNGMDVALSGVKDTPDTDGAERDIIKSIQAVMAQLPEGYSPNTFMTALNRAQVQEPSAQVLFESLLVSLVGNFEMQVASSARSLLVMYPGSLETSERAFTWREVSEHESLEAFREVVFEKAIDDLMRDSAAGWFKWFDSKFKIKIPILADDIKFREVLQRRHVIVHNGGNVSRLYLENVPELAPAPALGTHLEVDEEYMRSAADALLVTGLALVGNIGRKVLRDKERADFENILANLPYRMLQDGRYAAAAYLCQEFEPESFDDQAAKLITRVNLWLALKRLNRFDECRGEVFAWDTSVLSPEYQLARLALLDEMERGHDLVKKIRGTEHLSLAFWFAWPLLAELRAYERTLDEPPQGGE